ncbi:hypothetical protein AGRHK599_LOCUS183 [Rhizobium rhizogenes]|uniref:Flagellin n=2 Tax=Rhizobium/Agrobacterium group TaxID=227290 RepID=U4PTY9_9HYPH|nr:MULTISPECIES: flagellin [Rhizobium/Agrobacterium group]PZP61154.1 MAG: flagellin [Delftia acidovorans]AQS62680.1 flagellin [Rhizobium rhizogenes]MCZ7441830.1 flagellin [Rhizobium rhizogenes]NSX89610.1 flagellin [Agrobacterium tumefaciens]NSZ77961.1 flagellin [Agrobacterium tumefaciens]
MASILTNINAMSALQTLRSISSNMEDTQSRISSGLKVGSASDNAAYWSIATTMRSDNEALGAVQDALGLGAAKVDTAYAGMESVIDVVKQIKNKLVTAQESSADKTKIQGEITQLQDQLKGIVESASFSGENWLKADLSAAATTKSVVGSFVREGGTVSVKTIDYLMDASKVLVDTRATGTKTGILDKVQDVGVDTVTLTINDGGTLSEHTVQAYSLDTLTTAGAEFQGNFAKTATDNYVKVEGSWVKAVASAGTQEIASTTTAAGTITAGTWMVDTTNAGAGTVAASGSVLSMNISSLTGTQLSALVKAVDKSLTELTSAGAQLGSISSRISLQEDFASKLKGSIDKGVGRLVDADMNEESTRLKALQTQQQLAIQSLSIANSDSQNILSLFR